MSWRMARNSILAVCAAGAALAMSGCGSSSANVVTVTVTPSAITVLAGQVTTFTATVGGSTTTTVTNWPCTYVYTPLPTTATPNPTPTKAAPCNSGDKVNGGSIGTWTISTTNGSNVLTYTAPSLSNFPNPIPTITFTATADAAKSKTATATVNLDSGIRVSVTPATATVPVGLTPNQTVSFSPTLQNSPALNLQWNLVQPNSASTNSNDTSPNPLSDTCSPTCGTIDANGIFSAPSALPTDTTPAGSKSTAATTVYVVVSSKSDPLHFAVATITLINASKNPVTFSGVYPNTINVGVAAGGIAQDIFLNAKNLLNTTNISFVAPSLAVTLENAATTLSTVQPEALPASQVFTTIPISSAYCKPSASGVTPVVTCDASLVGRVRLLSKQLATPEPDPDHPAWILISNIPGSTAATPPCVVVAGGAGATTTAIACPFNIVNAGPGLVASVPNSFPQSSQAGTIAFGFDGGYYGVSSGLAIADFDGQAVTLQSSTPRRLVGNLPATFQIPQPGLYQTAVTFNNAQGIPPLFPLVISDAAVQPNFVNFSPGPSGTAGNCAFPTLNPPVTFPSCELLAAPGTNLAPSSMAINSTDGYAVLTEQGANALQMIDLTANPPALQAPFTGPNNPIAPTSVAINNQVTNGSGGSLGAVVSSGDGKIYLYWFSRTAQPQFIASFPVGLSALLGQNINTSATPFAIGIDPGTNLGVVAYSNPNISTNLAFIVNLNSPGASSTATTSCFSGGTPPCAVAPVAVNTGAFPQVIMQPNVPIAYVTPGGSTLGTTSVVNLLQTSTSVKIAPAGASQTTSGAYWDGINAHITTLSPHGINPLLGGTVIISGIMSANGVNFNGTFTVSSVIDPYSFTYPLPAPLNSKVTSDTETNTSTNEGTVQYGTPYYSFSTTSSASGGAINPISRTFAYADFNSTGSQIGFISTLDQSLSSLTLTAGSCNGCTPTTTAPETNFRSVAFDPFVDVLVAYAPGDNADPNFNGNKISLINPGTPVGITAPTFPYRIIAAIPTGQAGLGAYTPSGQTAPVPVNGPMGYDPKTKLVLVANAGSNSLSYMSLDPSLNPQGTFKNLQILSMNITSAGIPNNQPPLGTAPLTKPCSFATTGDPTVPTCMPQAVPLGQPATIKIFGKGFSSGTAAVRLDRQTSMIPPGQTTAAKVASTVVSDAEIDATIDAGFFFTPHTYAVDVQVSGGAASNSVNLNAVAVTPLAASTLGCAPNTTAFPLPQGPEAVAIDPTRHIALITNYACNSVSVIAVNPSGYRKADGSVAAYGTLLGNVGVGPNPIGIDVLPRMALAVVANNGATPSGTASIIDYSSPEAPKLVSWPTTSGSTTTSNAVTVGLSPLGVAIDRDRAVALVANNGSNTLSAIDLTVLLPNDPASGGGHVLTAPTATTVALSGPPTAIAVDPNNSIAVVTNLQNSGTTSVTGGIDVVNLASSPPIKSSTASVSSLTATLTGIVYDPGDPLTTPATPSVFYAASTMANAIYSFNPISGSVQTVRVGINPYSVAYNPQTGTLLTINSTSNSSSLVDAQTFNTENTLGISSLSQFAVAIDPMTNTAVIVDQNNNRVLGLALP